MLRGERGKEWEEKSENEKRKFHDSIFNMIFPIKVQRTRTLLKLCKDNFTQSQSFLFADFSSFLSMATTRNLCLCVRVDFFPSSPRLCVERRYFAKSNLESSPNYFRAPHFITTTTRHGRKRMELIFIWLWLSSHIFLCFLFKDKYFFVI